MKKKNPNIALIGCGRIGFLLENDPLRYKPCTHYGGAAACGLAVTCACDINPERLARFGALVGIERERLFGDYRDLLRNARPEMAIIATWTESHSRIAIEAARRGAQVIVLEKPMASTLSQCRAIINECRKSGASVIISHERRYDNRYRRLKNIIERGAIGEIKTVHASMLTGGNTGLSDPADGGGPLLHDGTHIVDMIRFLFGEIISVEGEFQRAGRSRGFEDRACAWLKTAGNIDIFLEAGGNRKYFVFELEISGTAGKIVIGNGYEELYTNRKSRFYTGFRDIVKTPFPSWKKNNCFQELYREARRALGGTLLPVSSADDGYRALEVIHAVYLSSHLGGKRISLPLGGERVNLKKIFNIK
ncbi:MAG: Gfo/Idh/MocA family oxidoreductase [Spirochaetes bacterium]|nr:Gfo/Idh/MocA family oxidoreductase [Spirochaetota bacterium]